MFEKKTDKNGNVSYSIKTLVNDVFESEGVAGVIALILISTICFLIIIQTLRGEDIELPAYLTEFSALVFGYYFGRKKK